MADAYIGLVHYPVYNKNREVIASALTTIDMHDLARLAATYGLTGFYVITPLEDQIRLAEEMVEHWRRGWGAAYNQDRGTALSLVRIAPYLEDAVREIEGEQGMRPLIIGTSAANGGERIAFSRMKTLKQGEQPLLIVFGTAWGLSDEASAVCDGFLEPVKGPTDYNHLSVRSAAGIIVDRVFGQR